MNYIDILGNLTYPSNCIEVSGFMFNALSLCPIPTVNRGGAF